MNNQGLTLLLWTCAMYLGAILLIDAIVKLLI